MILIKFGKKSEFLYTYTSFNLKYHCILYNYTLNRIKPKLTKSIVSNCSLW